MLGLFGKKVGRVKLQLNGYRRGYNKTRNRKSNRERRECVRLFKGEE